MMNWTAGKPNARFHVLKLLNAHFRPGDRLVATAVCVGFNLISDLAAQAFMTSKGKKLLLTNKRIYPVEGPTADLGHVIRVEVVDEQSGEGPARSEQVDRQLLRLDPFAVAVASIE